MELRFAPESEVAPKLRLGEYHYQCAEDLEDLSCVIEEDRVCLGGKSMLSGWALPMIDRL